jgi:hypothetical protein
MNRLACILVLLSISCEAATEIQNVDHSKERRWLNEHVIAVGNDGLAIEPFDFLSGATFNFGLVRWHQGKKTKLQVSDDRWDAAAQDSGLEDVQPAPPPPGATRYFFRDVVVSHMLATAAASHKKIVIFAHGGMNNEDEAIAKAWTYGHYMEKDVYPIFICWESSMGSSYLEHLTSVRNGTDISRDSPFWAGFTAPIYFGTDIATSIVRFPRTIADLSRVGFKAWNGYDYGDVQDATVRYYTLHAASGKTYKPVKGESEEHEKVMAAINSSRSPGKPLDLKKLENELAGSWEDLRNRPGAENWEPISVSKGTFSRTTGDSTLRVLGYFGLIPTKIAVLSFFGGAGQEMWGVMSRRTKIMFHHEGSVRPAFGQRPSAESYDAHQDQHRYSESDADVAFSESTGVGALAVFCRGLEVQQSRHLKHGPIVLVGHSMGAMIFCEALREFPDVEFDGIDYMAAACSINDFNTSVVPYLDKHPNTEFYSLCLNPRAEDRERSLGENIEGELVPRGSLLVWIDEFLDHPKSFADRTFGYFENAVMASLMIPPRVQKQVHFVALSAGPGEPPLQHHGDFSHYKFWEPEFFSLQGDVPRCKFDLEKEEASMEKRFGTPAKPGPEAL